MTLLLQIVATPDGVSEVDIHRAGQEGARLYQALLPVLDAINEAIQRGGWQERQAPEDGVIPTGTPVVVTSAAPVIAVAPATVTDNKVKTEWHPKRS